MKFKSFAALALVAAGLPASAALVVSETAASLTDCCRVVTGYASWTQSVTYTNVSISAYLFDVNVDKPGTAVAYLTNQIGPGTTSANEVTAPFNISISNTTSAPTLLFSGLTLGPGNYFLTINPIDQVEWDDGNGLSVRSLGFGVTQSANPNMNQGPIDPYAPASAFTLTGQALYTVTGDLAGETSAPEPATGAFALAGIGALIWARRRSQN